MASGGTGTFSGVDALRRALEKGKPEPVYALLGGDPILAGLALLAALVLLLFDARAASTSRGWGRGGFALLAGSLLAAPQLLLTREILAESYRGTGTVTSVWHFLHRARRPAR